MSRERDRWGKFESGDEKRKKIKKKEHFKASQRGSFDKLITKGRQTAVPAAPQHHSRPGPRTPPRWSISLQDRLILRSPSQPSQVWPSLSQYALAWFIVYCNAQMAIGAVYLNDCPGQPFIPVYLLVLGAFVLLDTLLLCSPYDLTIFADVAHGFILVFLVFWFISGNVCIYSIYRPSFNPVASALYCNKALYLFAFCTTTMINILLFLTLLCACWCLYKKETVWDKILYGY